MFSTGRRKLPSGGSGGKKFKTTTVLLWCVASPIILVYVILLFKVKAPANKALDNPLLGVNTAHQHFAVKAPVPAPAPAPIRTSKEGHTNFVDQVKLPAPKPKVQHTIPPVHQQKMMMSAELRPRGLGVKPDEIVPLKSSNEVKHDADQDKPHPDSDHVLTAFVEQVDFDAWNKKPLPVRTTTADQLEVIQYPMLKSCSKLPEQMPADFFPDDDTYLPWIHDVFPTHDGKFIQFVAQNRRRCHTGTTDEEVSILFHTKPQEALFQHVAVKRVQEGIGSTRYRLSTHEEADPDGVATRFICRFKPSMEETLSVYNFDYEWISHRKRLKHTFFEYNGGIKNLHTSQLIFQCPVPDHLVETVRTGESVVNDWATLFVDIIPIRTPTRFGAPNEFLQPKYKDQLPGDMNKRFNYSDEYGNNHILPAIEDSGRWENFPICRPSLEAFYNEIEPADTPDEMPVKKHRLVACMWSSAGYTTRGERFAINDGQRRLLEWYHLNKMLGIEHFYLYDNSYAFSDETTLKPIADMFPEDFTYIKWPYNVCNNNPNNVDSPGERSSQYAAESSCRLRFGPHVEWIAQFDMDEYLMPMGEYTDLLQILDMLEKQKMNVLSFGSWRAWPRRAMIEKPIPITDPKECQSRKYSCFELKVPMNYTMLQAYNCDRQPPGQKKDTMPAEKQLYRPDYVLQHFIHYSTVTTLSAMSRPEFEAAGMNWNRQRVFPDPKSRFVDEVKEGIMIHTKAIARQDTSGWDEVCRVNFKGPRFLTCRLGNPFTADAIAKNATADESGWIYNCYINRKVEDYFIPRLEKLLAEHHGDVFLSN